MKNVTKTDLYHRDKQSMRSLRRVVESRAEVRRVAHKHEHMLATIAPVRNRVFALESAGNLPDLGDGRVPLDILVSCLRLASSKIVS